MSRKVVRHTYRNVKIRSILHFDSGLPTTDELSRDSNFTKKYNLVDVVPENKISTTGTGYRTNLSMFRADVNFYNSINGNKISEYSNYGGYTYIVKNSRNGVQSSYITSPYPFVLGGQDFTIEIGAYFKQIGPIFYFSPQNQINKIQNSIGNYTTYQEYLIPSSIENIYSFGLSLSSYKINEYTNEYSYYFRLKLPGDNKLYLFGSIDYITDKLIESMNNDITSLQDPKDCYLNTKLQITIVYRHRNIADGTNPFLFYINGYKGEAATDDEEQKFGEYVFNRTGFLYEFIGQYHVKKNEECEIYFDEFRICDGIALYSGDSIDYPQTTLYDFSNDQYQAKFVSHFDTAKINAIFNKMPPPTLVVSEPLNKGFSYELKFNGDHQYLEYIRDNNLIPGADAQTLTNIEPVNDHEDKYWKSGMNLGGRNFTIESFLKFNRLATPIKKRTIFEFNEKGCTNPNHYFRMIYDFDTNVMIIEQNNITDIGYKELLRFTVPTNRKFHWFLCYHYDKKTLKAYIDENEMNSDYILGLPKDYTDDVTIERFIECGRNVTDAVKENIKEYIAENVDFGRVNFEHLILASNIAPMNNDSSSYPYSNSYAGTMEEFRLLDGVAAEPYTPEFPYSIYDDIQDWDDEQDYEENILELNFSVCKELPPTDILELNFEVEKITYTYGPRDILTLNFEIKADYDEDMLELNFKVEQEYINNNLLELNFTIEDDYEDNILNLNFKVEDDYNKDNLLELNFKVEDDYEEENILELNFKIEQNYNKNDLLNLNFKIKKDYDEDILNLKFWIREPGEYRNTNFLILNFKINPETFDENILYLNFKIKDDYIKDNLLNLNFKVEDGYTKNNLLKLNFKIEGNYTKNNLLNLNFRIDNDTIDKDYELLNILNLKFKIMKQKIEIDYKFDTKRIIPNTDEYLIIAVSFV